MNTEEYQKIDDYLFGNLSEADKLAFEDQMATDEGLAKAVAVQRLEHRAMTLAIRDDLRAQMSAWKQELVETDIAPKTAKVVEMPQATAKVIPLSRQIYKWAAAAAVLLVAIVGGRLLFAPAASPLALAQSFYEEPALSSKGVGNNTLLTESENLLVEGKYQEAINRLLLLQDSTTAVQRLFLLGHAYFKQGNFPTAATTFEQIGTYKTDDFNKQRAEWLFLLSRLATGQKDKTFEGLLDKIRSSTSVYRSKAEALKKRL